jgi:hypothetical protein
METNEQDLILYGSDYKFGNSLKEETKSVNALLLSGKKTDWSVFALTPEKAIERMEYHMRKHEPHIWDAWVQHRKYIIDNNIPFDEDTFENWYNDNKNKTIDYNINTTLSTSTEITRNKYTLGDTLKKSKKMVDIIEKLKRNVNVIETNFLTDSDYL